MDEIHNAFRNFIEYWQDMDNIYVNMQNLATVVSYSVASIVTILIIYLGWLYTKSKRVEDEKNKKFLFESDPQQNRLGLGVAHRPGSTSSEYSNKWRSDNLDMDKIPKACPMSKLYSDVANLDKVLQHNMKNTETAPPSDPPAEDDAPDPVEFCEHIQSEYKRTQQRIALKKAERDMTDEQKERERDIQRQQLEAIYTLMEQQNDKFGVNDITEMHDQVKLYM